jgi:signal transduction histidine kinase
MRGQALALNWIPLRSSKFQLGNLLDYFIPAEMQVNAESHRRARMFMLSHAFGPILGNTIPLYMAVTGISRDYRVIVFFLSILTFWTYPFFLRKTGRYQLISLISVQNLVFCALWACWAYGGMASPFLPWILIFPLLAFLYLPSTGRIRNLLLIQIFGSVAAYIVLCFSGIPLPRASLSELQTIGMISMASVAIYFSMMSLYFAKMFREQREFTRELNGLVSTSDNLRNLTAAANQASAAKADFVAGMSHELRTPLNAIIGYSQLLLEEAEEENDKASIADLGNVHKAGSDLLRLIDDILAYSRIEAGKMPLNASFDQTDNHIARWKQALRELNLPAGYSVELIAAEAGPSLLTDWSSVGATIKHLAAGIASQKDAGRLTVSVETKANAMLVRFADFDSSGRTRPMVMIQEMFEHSDDASPTKYGGTGIEIALAFKLAQLLCGTIDQETAPDGTKSLTLTVPDLTQMRSAAAA